MVDQNLDLVPRHARNLVAEALTDTRVVTLNGARQAGKSTLARLAAKASPNAVIRLLDDPPRCAQRAPDFVEHGGLMVIDEVQLAPELFRSIKELSTPTQGRAGSAHGFGAGASAAAAPDALPAGWRSSSCGLLQGEIDRSPDAFIDAAFNRGPALSRNSALRKRHYLDRIVRGGYPEAVRRSPRRRAAFFDSYLTNLIERDVKELAVIERRSDLRRLLVLLAGRTGSLLVAATLAAESGIPRTTLNRYLELLSAVFLIKQIPAWSASQTHRAVGTPKLAFTDTGIASHLLGQDASCLGEPDGAAGPMIETFVLMELARQLTWSSERARLHHYRTKDKVEVDAVLETPDGRVVAIEVKAGATVRAEDLTGLRHLAQRLGPRLVAGYVLYTGQQTLPFGDRLRALPIDALWQTSP